MVDIYESTEKNPKGYAPPEVIDWEKKSDQHNHGEEGHIGYRCAQCAYLSGAMVSMNEHGIDHWQDKQIAWQEECDKRMSAFDVAVAEHFPVHRERDPLCECPQRPNLPEKPAPPFERSLGKVNE